MTLFRTSSLLILILHFFAISVSADYLYWEYETAKPTNCEVVYSYYDGDTGEETCSFVDREERSAGETATYTCTGDEHIRHLNCGPASCSGAPSRSRFVVKAYGNCEGVSLERVEAKKTAGTDQQIDARSFKFDGSCQGSLPLVYNGYLTHARIGWNFEAGNRKCKKMDWVREDHFPNFIKVDVGARGEDVFALTALKSADGASILYRQLLYWDALDNYQKSNPLWQDVTPPDVALVDVSSNKDATIVWGVVGQPANNIDPNTFKTETFIDVDSWTIANQNDGPTSLVQIDVSRSHNVQWGVDVDNKVYRRFLNTADLEQCRGYLKHVTVSRDGSEVWGVARDGDVYRRDGFADLTEPWTKVSSYQTSATFVQLDYSTGLNDDSADAIWGVDENGDVYYMFPDENMQWTRDDTVPTEFVWIAVSDNKHSNWYMDTDVFYAVARNGLVYEKRAGPETWDWNSFLNKPWTPMTTEVDTTLVI